MLLLTSCVGRSVEADGLRLLYGRKRLAAICVVDFIATSVGEIFCLRRCDTVIYAVVAIQKVVVCVRIEVVNH